MADEITLTGTFEDIADAIREKGISGTMKATDMPGKIRQIAQLDPEDYYTKSETSSAAELSDAFASIPADVATQTYVQEYVEGQISDFVTESDVQNMGYTTNDDVTAIVSPVETKVDNLSGEISGLATQTDLDSVEQLAEAAQQSSYDAFDKADDAYNMAEELDVKTDALSGDVDLLSVNLGMFEGNVQANADAISYISSEVSADVDSTNVKHISACYLTDYVELSTSGTPDPDTLYFCVG